MLNTKQIEYYDGHSLLQGYCAYQDDTKEKRPVILVAHDWSGQNEFARKKADLLASLGYIGFAIDMYGEGKVGQTKEEKMAFMQPLMADRQLLQKRILAAYQVAKEFELSNQLIGAIGFCFGGLCALDLARSGAAVQAIVSFHGLLQAPENNQQAISAKVLALHGYDDPMVNSEQMLQFANEMTEKKVDWQLHLYGNTMHAFTNPEANDPSFGTVYNSLADTRSWIAMRDFFAEVF